MVTHETRWSPLARLWPAMSAAVKVSTAAPSGRTRHWDATQGSRRARARTLSFSPASDLFSDRRRVTRLALARDSVIVPVKFGTVTGLTSEERRGSGCLGI